MLTSFPFSSIHLLPWNISFFALRSFCSVSSKLVRHPYFRSISETTFLVVPETALLKGIFDGLARGRLPQEVNLVRFILYIFLLLVLLEILIQSPVVIVGDSDRSLHF